LLLTAPMLPNDVDAISETLTSGEFRKFTLTLNRLNLALAQLLEADFNSFPPDVTVLVERQRLERLLSRGFQLSQAIERWQSKAIWILGFTDHDYPARIKNRLNDHAPAVVYGCGDRSILETGGLAVVGSRDVDTALVEFTERVGRLAAEAGRTLISGAARGIDQAAMRGALEAGGKVVGVMADGLERAVSNYAHREYLLDNRLVLLSPYDPLAGFNIGNAMNRNKLIYALSEAALVVNSDLEKGGTWAGAIEQLEKLHFVPIYVRSEGESSKGLEALRRKGALAWPSPRDSASLEQILTMDRAESGAQQLSLLET